jgi:hypothetical protein
MGSGPSAARPERPPARDRVRHALDRRIDRLRDMHRPHRRRRPGVYAPPADDPPMSDALENIPKHGKDGRTPYNTEPYECAICLDDATAPIYRLPCGHKPYCDRCYEELVGPKPANATLECPLCRRAYTKAHVHIDPFDTRDYVAAQHAATARCLAERRAPRGSRAVRRRASPGPKTYRRGR